MVRLLLRRLAQACTGGVIALVLLYLLGLLDGTEVTDAEITASFIVTAGLGVAAAASAGAVIERGKRGPYGTPILITTALIGASATIVLLRIHWAASQRMAAALSAKNALTQFASGLEVALGESAESALCIIAACIVAATFSGYAASRLARRQR